MKQHKQISKSSHSILISEESSLIAIFLKGTEGAFQVIQKNVFSLIPVNGKADLLC